MVDVVGALKSPTTIDRSVIDGEEVLLCACTSWWPQQANSGIGCRFCYIGPDEYGGVNFDLKWKVSPIVAMREDMESLHTKNSLQCRYEPRTISSRADLASFGYPHFRGWRSCSLGVQEIEAPRYCPYYTGHSQLCRMRPCCVGFPSSHLASSTRSTLLSQELLVV
jgi:hypothetical protein